MGWNEVLIVALLGGVAALDKSTLLMLFSEPLLLCTAAGAYMHNLEAGLMMGMMWQLVWMGELPMGAAKVPDGSAGALISAMLYFNLSGEFTQMKNLTLAFCLVSGVFSAYLGGQFISDKRKFHRFYLDRVDKFALKNHLGSIESMFFLGLAEHFLVNAVFVLFVYLILHFLLYWVISNISTYWDGLFRYMDIAIWGFAAAVVFDLFWNRKAYPAVLGGIILAVLIFYIV